MEKIKNRIFALFFAAFFIIWVYYLATKWDVGIANRTELIVPVICFIIIIFGLFIEIWKPSFDFSLNKNKKWTVMSLILFCVFFLINIYWWIAHGIPIWLPKGFGITIVEYFIGTFAMETSSFSFLLGILFLTKTTPKKSLSYKLILIGVLLFEFFLLLGYLKWMIIGVPSSRYYADFFGFTIFQPWFWLDLTSEIIISLGSVCLLWKIRLK